MRLINKRIFALSLGALLLVPSGIGLIHPHIASAATYYTVTSKADDPDTDTSDGVCDTGGGECTLRAAIEQANVSVGDDYIAFGISGTPDFINDGQDGFTIELTGDLPQITDRVTIDGYTQNGSLENTSAMGTALDTRLLIQITSSGDNIFKIASNNVRVKGLVLNGAANLGGAAIGIDSGNNTQIYGNFIGTDPTGMIAKPNFAGISLNDGTNTRIGDGNPASVNLISGNTPGGILVFHATGAQINGNVIGPTATLDTTQGLSSTGGGVIFVAFNSGSDNMVGNTSGQTSNIVAGLGGGIIAISGDLGTPIRDSFLGNSIYDNAGLFGGSGINLMKDTDGDSQPDEDLSSNANDSGDADGGANDYLNTPVIHSAAYDAGAQRLYVRFDLDVAGSPSDEYHVEFFANDTNTPGEGKTLVHSFDTVAAGLDQAYDFQPDNSYDLTGKHITSTVTQKDQSFTNQGYGSTSEFSEPFEVVPFVQDLDISKVLLNPNDIHVGGTADYRVTITNNSNVSLPPITGNDFGVYDMFTPNLTYQDIDSGHSCLIGDTHDMQGFFDTVAINHTNYKGILCFVQLPNGLSIGASISFTVRFVVDSIPDDGFASYTLLPSASSDPDFSELMAYVTDMGGHVDLVDAYNSGLFTSNGNFAAAQWVKPQTGAPGDLATSGQTPIFAVSAGATLLFGLMLIRSRRQNYLQR